MGGLSIWLYVLDKPSSLSGPLGLWPAEKERDEENTGQMGEKKVLGRLQVLVSMTFPNLDPES
jgi:hypothetical protein